MRNLFLYAIVLILASACSSNSEKSDNNVYKKHISSIVTVFPNITNDVGILYDEHNYINQIVLGGDIDEAVIKIEYSALGLISKLDYFFDKALFSYKTIEWFTDSLHITKTTVSDSNDVASFRETYFYNDNKEMVGIDRYVEDSLGNWEKRGSKYEFEWNNGNMVKILCFIANEHEVDDSVIVSNNIDDANMFELDNVSNMVIHNGYTLYYESTYTYDDKNNPYENTSISQIILPNEGNISANNPVTIEKRYSEQEVINFRFNYVYNEEGYPTKSIVDVTSNIEGLEKTQYTRAFKY